MPSEDYVNTLLRERSLLDPVTFENANRLLTQEIERVESGPHNPDERAQFVEEKVKLSEKVLLPVKEFPHYNFVGKVLGPKGSTLKMIAKTSKTKISILGRGSLRDKEKEEELSQSSDPQHQHLKEPLHLLIQVDAPRSEAHARVAAAMNDLQMCLAQQVSHEQINELNSGKMQDTYNISEIAKMGGPVIRFGIPPPGAIVLNGDNSSWRGNAQGSARGRGRRPPH